MVCMFNKFEVALDYQNSSQVNYTGWCTNLMHKLTCGAHVGYNTYYLLNEHINTKLCNWVLHNNVCIIIVSTM